MDSEFIDRKHFDNFYNLVEQSKIANTDMDRKALFYIIAGNEDLMSKVDALYDFKDRSINLDWQQRADFSGGIIRLVTLAFNLYNGYECNPYDIFSSLCPINRKLAHNAIRIRFPY